MSRRTERVVFGILVLAAALPAVVIPTLPFQDFPEHVLQLALLRHLGEPAFGAGLHYEAHLLTPYGGAILLAWPFAPLCGDEGAMRLVLALSLAGIPLAARYLLASMRREPALAVLAIPLAWGWITWIGFLPFLLAVPLALLGAATAWRLAAAERPRGRDLGLLAVLGLATFACHALALPFLCLAAGLLVLFSARPRRLVPVVLALLPAIAVAAVWTSQRVATVNPEPRPLYWDTFKITADSFFGYVNGSWRREVRPFVFGIAAIGLCLASAWLARREEPARPRDPGRRAGALAGLALLVGYFACPMSILDAWGLPGRFAPFFALALAAVDLPRAPASRRRVQLALALLVAGDLAHLWHQLVVGSREASGGREIQADLRPGSRVFFEGKPDTSRAVALAVFRHFGAYHVAAHGGDHNDSFARFPHQLARYKDGPPLRSPVFADAWIVKTNHACASPPPFAVPVPDKVVDGEFFRFRVVVPPEGWQLLFEQGPMSPCELWTALGHGKTGWCPDITASVRAPFEIPGVPPSLSRVYAPGH